MFTDTTRKGTNASATSPLTVTHNSAQAGNLLITGCSTFVNSTANQVPPTVDDSGNTWSRIEHRAQIGGSDQTLATLFASILGTGGNRSVVFTSVGTFMSGFTHEFTIPNSDLLYKARLNGATAGTADSNPIGEAVGAALYLGMLSARAAGTTTENVSPGDTDWTLSNEHEGAVGQTGSLVFFIGSDVRSRHAAWTLAASDIYATVIAQITIPQFLPNIKDFPIRKLIPDLYTGRR